MLAPFLVVVDYRHYHLMDTTTESKETELRYMYKVKKKIDGLYPKMGLFSRFEPIKLLSFLATIKEVVEALEKYEGVVVFILEYFLSYDAKDAHQSQIVPGTCNSALETTRPYVVHVLIRRLLTDDLLQTAHNEVSRAIQRDF